MRIYSEQQVRELLAENLRLTQRVAELEQDIAKRKEYDRALNVAIQIIANRLEEDSAK